MRVATLIEARIMIGNEVCLTVLTTSEGTTETQNPNSLSLVRHAVNKPGLRTELAALGFATECVIERLR